MYPLKQSVMLSNQVRRLLAEIREDDEKRLEAILLIRNSIATGDEDVSAIDGVIADVRAQIARLRELERG